MKTTIVKPSAPRWLLIDANGQSLGRLSARAASILRGKHRPQYSPHQIQGDHVIIINASGLSFMPAKLYRKKYYSHTGFTGHVKVTLLADLFKKDPVKVIEKAVKGMLANNRLRNEMLRRLHVYAGGEHGHDAQTPEKLDFSGLRRSTRN